MKTFSSTKSNSLTLLQIWVENGFTLDEQFQLELAKEVFQNSRKAVYKVIGTGIRTEEYEFHGDLHFYFDCESAQVSVHRNSFNSFHLLTLGLSELKKLKSFQSAFDWDDVDVKGKTFKIREFTALKRFLVKKFKTSIENILQNVLRIQTLNYPEVKNWISKIEFPHDVFPEEHLKRFCAEKLMYPVQIASYFLDTETGNTVSFEEMTTIQQTGEERLFIPVGFKPLHPYFIEVWNYRHTRPRVRSGYRAIEESNQLCPYTLEEISESVSQILDSTREIFMNYSTARISDKTLSFHSFLNEHSLNRMFDIEFHQILQLFGLASEDPSVVAGYEEWDDWSWSDTLRPLSDIVEIFSPGSPASESLLKLFECVETTPNLVTELDTFLSWLIFTKTSTLQLMEIVGYELKHPIRVEDELAYQSLKKMLKLRSVLHSGNPDLFTDQRWQLPPIHSPIYYKSKNRLEINFGFVSLINSGYENIVFTEVDKAVGDKITDLVNLGVMEISSEVSEALDKFSELLERSEM